MNDKIFRKKSVDKMSSPEQLNDYVKVTNPGVWMALAAIAVLLIGICVWGVFGKLETKLTVAATPKRPANQNSMSATEYIILIRNLSDRVLSPYRKKYSAPLPVSANALTAVMYTPYQTVR